MRALVLSGGSCKGAYQIGALKYLLNDLYRQYDIYCGISVGALNSAFLGMYKSGQELEALKNLLDIWHSIDTSKIYKRWFPFGRFHALWKSSFYNSKPLQDLVRKGLDLQKLRSSGKKVCVGAVSLTTGEYRVFDEKFYNFENAVIASSSFPGMLCPIEIEGQLWTDGGVKEITPLRTAIELGATDIDVIITSPSMSTSQFPSDPNTLHVIERTIDLMSDEIIANDISKAVFYNKLVEVGCAPNKKQVNINLIRPTANLVENTLDFDPVKIREMIDRGYHDAKYYMTECKDII